MCSGGLWLHLHRPRCCTVDGHILMVRGPTRHVMSGCVGSPTNGSENGRMAIGRGDASIGPSWAPCEVSAELSIVGAASGGSDVGGGASQSRRVRSQARLATRTVLRVIQGGRLSTCCAATQGEVLRAQRRVSGEGAALIWVGVAGECPAWQRSALASCGNVDVGKVGRSGDLGSRYAKWAGGRGFAGCSWGGCRQASATPGG